VDALARDPRRAETSSTRRSRFVRSCGIVADQRGSHEAVTAPDTGVIGRLPATPTQIFVTVPEADTLYWCEPSSVSIALPSGLNARTASIEKLASLCPFALDESRDALTV
jgi:hypothetical protein